MANEPEVIDVLDSSDDEGITVPRSDLRTEPRPDHTGSTMLPAPARKSQASLSNGGESADNAISLLARPDHTGSTMLPAPARKSQASLSKGGESADSAISLLDSDDEVCIISPLMARVASRRRQAALAARRPRSNEESSSLTLDSILSSTERRRGNLASSSLDRNHRRREGNSVRTSKSPRKTATERNPVTGAIIFRVYDSDEDSSSTDSDDEVPAEAFGDAENESPDAAGRAMGSNTSILGKRPPPAQESQTGKFKQTGWFRLDQQPEVSVISGRPVASNEIMDELLSLQDDSPGTDTQNAHLPSLHSEVGAGKAVTAGPLHSQARKRKETPSGEARTPPTTMGESSYVQGNPHQVSTSVRGCISKTPPPPDEIAGGRYSAPASTVGHSLGRSAAREPCDTDSQHSPPAAISGRESTPITPKTGEGASAGKKADNFCFVSESITSPLPLRFRSGDSTSQSDDSGPVLFIDPPAFDDANEGMPSGDVAIGKGRKFATQVMVGQDNVFVPTTPSRSEFEFFSGPQAVIPPIPSDDMLPTEEYHELMQPPPASDLHLDAQSRKLVSRSQSNPLDVSSLRAWNELGRRLRAWQVREGRDFSCVEDDMVASQSEPIAMRPTSNGGKYKVPKEDRKFAGGKDPPIGSEQRSAELNAMNFAPSLGQDYKDEKTGLPFRIFAVVNGTDNLIYRFKLHVKASSIPNAGYGAFLMFLGAQELKPSKKKRREEIRDRRPPNDSGKLFESLTVQHAEGFGIKLTLTGEHLKSWYNSYYTLPKLEAAVPDDRISTRKAPTRKFGVNLSDPDLAFDADELEGLRNPQQRIGHYGLFTEEDYVDAPKRTFSSLHAGNGYIDIGRYGPFRKEDRKFDFNNQAKSFLFGFEPNVWSFGVPESMFGQGQVIDITCDITGEPHEIARSFLPMYVNEVGHLPKNRKTTIFAFDEDDRVIKYYLRIEEPMKKGDEIELLTDYDAPYENCRERKGYGKKNIREGIRGDDHFPTFLRRNFIERSDLTLDIKEAEVTWFYVLVEFCSEKIGRKLHLIADDFLAWRPTGENPLFSPLTSRQLVAIRRLEWLTTSMNERCRQLQQSPPTSACVAMLNQCDNYISDMKWGKWSDLFSLLDKYPKIVDRDQKSLRDELDREAVEEICFEVMEKLAMPLDESRWCPVAVELIETLSKATARTLWQNHDHTSLGQIFIEEAEKAALEIKKAASEIQNPARLARLVFGGDFKDPFMCPEESSVQPAAKKTGQSSKLIVVRTEDGPSSKGTLVGRPKAADNVSGNIEGIQTEWYIARQVYFVAAVLSKVALAEDPLFQDRLRSCLEISPEGGDTALAQPISPESVQASKPKKKGRVKSEGAKPNKRPDGERESVNAPLFWHLVWPCLKDECGWTLVRGNRPNDFYALPPGVVRGGGFQNRVDFFDSTPLVLNFLKTSPTWKDEPAILRCLEEYYDCKNLYEEIKGTKKIPKFPDKAARCSWLQDEVKRRKKE